MKGVESSMEWINVVPRQPSVSAAAEGRLELVHMDIGKTGAWGHPVVPFFCQVEKLFRPNLWHMRPSGATTCCLASLEAINPQERLWRTKF